MTENNFFNLGAKIAAAAQGRSAQDIVVMQGMNATVSNPRENNYGYLQKCACRIAADAFAEAGRKAEFEYHIFEKLASTPQWFPEFENYADSVFKALGAIAREHEKRSKELQADTVVKSASTLLPNLMSITGRTTPELVKIMAGAGALGGGITGGLYWLLNRHSQEDEDQAEVIKAKIDYYNRLSNEIKRQLSNKGVPPAAIAGKVRDIVEQQQNLY
jgi:hypothetical protein